MILRKKEIKMKTERELYQEHYKTNRDYKFYVKHEMTEKQIFEFKNGEYSVGCVNDGWGIWQASASREGYKLVPVEPPEDMDIKICRLVDHRIDVFEADRIYKAMIGAAP